MANKKSENPHEGHRERQRNRIKQNGYGVLLEHELLEFLLTYTERRKDTNPIAHELMSRFGSFDRVCEASLTELQKVPGIGESAAMLIGAIPEIIHRYLMAKNESADKRKPRSSRDLFELIYPFFVTKTTEHLYMTSFNNRGNIIDTILIHEGTVNQIAVDNAAIIRHIFAVHASAIALYHNHPDGVAQPSQLDISYTDTLLYLLESIGVRLLDHLVIANDQYFSIIHSPTFYMGRTSKTPSIMNPEPFSPTEPDAQENVATHSDTPEEI